MLQFERALAPPGMFSPFLAREKVWIKYSKHFSSGERNLLNIELVAKNESVKICR